MPPRSSWKGFIKLSLVSIPVRSFTSAESGSEVRLRQLHRECHSPIRYRKVCPIHGEVVNEEIVSGYEYSKGQFVVIEPEERDKLYIESDRSINIEGFVSREAVDPLYYEGKGYYLLPEGAAGLKPYALLRSEMAEKELWGVARVALYGREHLALLRPLDGALNLAMLYYENEVRTPQLFEDELKEPELSEEEKRLTSTLIEASRLPSFDLSRYQDTYRERLQKLIEAKVEGKEIAVAPTAPEPQVINLMDALKKSLARAQGGKAAEERAEPRKPAQKKAAPSVRHPAHAHGSRKKKLG
jgi:DNA end-binding protein Ku